MCHKGYFDGVTAVASGEVDMIREYSRVAAAVTAGRAGARRHHRTAHAARAGHAR